MNNELEQLGKVMDGMIAEAKSKLSNTAEKPKAVPVKLDFLRGDKGNKGDKGDKGDSVKGDKGDKGDPGQDGKPGTKGAKGDKGDVGLTGLHGKDGKDGEDGVDGDDGVSVVDAHIAADGNLVFDLSDGKEIDAGKLMEFDGANYIINTQVGSGGGGTTIVGITGTKAEFDTACSDGNFVFVGGDLGTPSAGVLTNCTGTASGLTAGTVTTNANLTGHVTSTGNAAVLGSFTVAQLNTALSDGDIATGGGTATGSNTGDNATNSQYSGLVTNATHTGDATGATALTVVGINSTLMSGLATGILKNTTTTGVPSIAVAGDFPTLNQNTTGTAAGLSATLAVTSGGTGATTLAGASIPTYSSTDTLTNKRVTKRTGTTTSSATPTINTDNVDFYSLTAQAEAITSFTTNLSGTPTENQILWIAVTGTAARALTFGASFEASTVALPTTTASTNRLDMGFVWNSVSSKWRIVATA